MAEEIKEEVKDETTEEISVDDINFDEELKNRDEKIKELTDTIDSLNQKILDLTEANAKIAKQLAYVEPEKEPEEKEPEVEFADFTNLYEED